MKSKWLKGAIKHPGRFKGKSAADMRSKMARLHKKAEHGNLSKSEMSLMRAAALGIRFKSGEFSKGKGKKKGKKK